MSKMIKYAIGLLIVVGTGILIFTFFNKNKDHKSTEIEIKKECSDVEKDCKVDEKSAEKSCAKDGKKSNKGEGKVESTTLHSIKKVENKKNINPNKKK